MISEIDVPGPAEPQDDVAEYNELVRAAELVEVRLVDLKFSVKASYYTALQSERSGGRTLHRTFDGNINDVFYDSETSTLGGQLDWQTLVKIGNRKLLSIDAQFLVMYGSVPPVQPLVLERYIQRVGKFATYPYFRALIAQLSWESKADLPIMPVLK